MGDATSGDHRLDAALPQQAAVLVEVVAPVGIQAPGSVAGASSQSPDRRDRIQQREELSDVMAVATGERDGKRGSAPVDDHMVLGAGPAAVDRRGADQIPLSAPGRVSCPQRSRPCLEGPHGATLSAERRAGATRRRPRSNPEADATPSLRSSRQSRWGHRARRHRSAAHTRSPQTPSGQELAAALGNGGAAREQAVTAEPPAPTGHLEQDQHAPGHPTPAPRARGDGPT